ncbi:MAG TPA: peroxiredoxin, partial [Chthoniobacterales bacterium]|nr:peroxiredoxin [Chthoniobacterales bacterium]
MKKSLLSAIVGFATLALMQGADTPTQPAAGTAAPDFSLSTSDGSQVSLKDFKGKWVVLYFYPKDMTSGCTIEAKNFQRDLNQYTKTGAVILGVSVDSA